MIEEGHWFVDIAIVGVFAMGFVAFALGGVIGFLHRSYAQSRVPFYAPIIVGLGAVGLWLNTASSLIMFVSGVGEDVAEPVVLANIELNMLTALVGGTTAYVGGRMGDRLAPTLQLVTNSRPARSDMSTVVKSAGRVIRVSIPEKIGTIDGHDPITDETKTQIAGQEWIFPRGLTVHELRERMITRLREDYHVGYVDLELNGEGVITYLALGRRVAGIGPTLPPRHVAIAITANPPPAASPGDLVEVWQLPEEDTNETSPEESAEVDQETEETLPAVLRDHPERWYRPDSKRFAFAVRTPDGGRRYRRTAADAASLLVALYDGDTSDGDADAAIPVEARQITRGELRARAGDVATVMIEENKVEAIDQSREYRLVTIPASRHPEKEFASLLRAANESMETVSVETGSDLVSLPLGAIKPIVVSIQSSDDDIETLPKRTRRCQAGDTLYAVGRPDQLRKLVIAGTADGVPS